MTASNKRYDGKALEQPTDEIAAYFPGKDLTDAVEYARLLRRPLLLRGEPGTGKTRLAQALAFELYEKDYRKKYFEWFIKSTSKVQEGIYRFDHLGRLRDIQASKEKDIHAYRSFGPLGKAFLASQKDEPSILLIDEIDKADIDFPNDLLLELDQKRFLIPETEEEVIAAEPPVIIITSNDEKELPNAFLRRCVFHFIDFPGKDELLRIVRAQAKRQVEEFKAEMPDPLVEASVERFSRLYKKMKDDPNTGKLPSTAELLDWIRLIHYYSITGDSIALADFEGEKLLFPEVLLKSFDDYKVQTNQ